MLILTRRVDEVIMIGADIQFAILGVKGNQVRIGVQAPRSIDVHREEVYQKIAAERKNASSQINKTDQDSFGVTEPEPKA